MDQSIIRISKELSDIQKSSDLGIAVACRDIDVRNLRALVFGPHETPYEFGFFEFAVKFSREYPSKSPDVGCITTNGGRCRFNPNIYSNGKVCLSILGTWRGEPGEQWSSAQGLESILLSIQSLLSANPYENEPGYEDAKKPEDLKQQKQYVQKIRHETLRVTVIQRLESYLHLDPLTEKPTKSGDTKRSDFERDGSDMIAFEPFQDLCKRRFLWYYESYLAGIELGKKEVDDGQVFERMPFEAMGSNIMEGTFNYKSLETRLRRIKKALEEETDRWVEEGLTAMKKESTVAVNLQHQYEQVVAHLKLAEVPHDVHLENDNPFVWVITYFGKPMTNLDGGLFRIKMHFSPRFPEEQPRVWVQPQLFHHRVAADGTMCYVPNRAKRDDVRSHIDAIVEALEDEEPVYDPRMIVNPEATSMFWGADRDDKKMYNRRLRRSVQRSMEDFPE